MTDRTHSIASQRAGSTTVEFAAASHVGGRRALQTRFVSSTAAKNRNDPDVNGRATKHAETVTVVLVHGAFADASSWNGVIERLQANGVKVMAPANPLRGIAADAAYIAAVLHRSTGPWSPSATPTAAR